MKGSEKALMIASRSSYGPWVPVENLSHVSVEGLAADESLRIVARDRTLATISQDGVHSVNVASGEIRAERISGEARVTVKAVES